VYKGGGNVEAKWVLYAGDQYYWIFAYLVQSGDSFASLTQTCYGIQDPDAIRGLATFNAEIAEAGVPTAAGDCANACSDDPVLYAGEWLYFPTLVGSVSDFYYFDCSAFGTDYSQDCSVVLYVEGGCGCACDGCWGVGDTCGMGTGTPC
jgi:hypothetical protein